MSAPPPLSYQQYRFPSRRWIVVVLLAAFSMTWGMTSFGLQDNNEGVYAEVAREMAHGGDWVIPHLNYLTYIEKPPMLYWCVAIFLKIFGDHEWAVRMVPLLFFSGTLVAVGLLSHLALTPRAGRRACIILVTAAGFLVMNRSLLFDVPLLCFTSFGVLCFYQWLVSGKESFLRYFYILLALGMLAKGVVALVIGGGTAVFATLWITRSWRTVLKIFDPVAIAIFFAVAAPWYVAATLREPDFPHFYFINEHVLRFLDKRVPRDYYTGPFYYYVLRFPLYLGFWFVFLPLIGRPHDKPAKKITGDEDKKDFRRLLWVWFLVPLIFFSISKAKANYYLMSGIPPLALLIGLGWPTEETSTGHRRTVAGTVVLLILAIVLPVGLIVMARRDPTIAEVPLRTMAYLCTLFIVTTLIALDAVVAAARRQSSKAFVRVAFIGIMPLLPIPWLLTTTQKGLTEKEVAEFIREKGPDKAVFIYRDFEKISSLSFYLKRPLSIINSHSNELYYARTRRLDPSMFLTDDEFRKLSQTKTVWLVARQNHLGEAAALCPGFHVVRKFHNCTVLANWN